MQTGDSKYFQETFLVITVCIQEEVDIVQWKLIEQNPDAQKNEFDSTSKRMLNQ